ncbi:transducin-like enhancer protein 2 [Limosa lapponica baueri]|uniref:Transducin-like enhancer protein 2 n=1 Tax=Limosa lapponica baueri TaxID=1758121 RepID=A0A2I0U4R4_LIMLA|nr:transducin-like enhancer protein 2 [Limosa lapponica baueri]
MELDESGEQGQDPVCQRPVPWTHSTTFTQTPLQPGQPFKFSVLEICDRIKEEFQFLQAQYHRGEQREEGRNGGRGHGERGVEAWGRNRSWRRWRPGSSGETTRSLFLGRGDGSSAAVMELQGYYEMSYGLNIEMHKQAEIVKRLSAICAQIIPFLTQEHQQQVLQAVERAKQVTMGELNSIVGPRAGPLR